MAMVGLFYRMAAPLFFFMVTYVFLIEQARYLNHFYLVCLIALVIAFVPAHRQFSLDSRLRPHLRTNVIPA